MADKKKDEGSKEPIVFHEVIPPGPEGGELTVRPVTFGPADTEETKAQGHQREKAEADAKKEMDRNATKAAGINDDIAQLQKQLADARAELDAVKASPSVSGPPGPANPTVGGWSPRAVAPAAVPSFAMPVVNTNFAPVEGSAAPRITVNTYPVLKDRYNVGIDIPFLEAVLLANDRDRGMEAAGCYTLARDPGWFRDTDPEDRHVSRIIVQSLRGELPVGYHSPDDFSPGYGEK